MSDGYADEVKVRALLRRLLDPAFETFEEVPVRHALFRRRRLRADVLAIPRDPAYSDIAVAFETKSAREWDIPSLSQALKQASDYVLSTVEPDTPAHAGKRVMATFIFPGLEFKGEGVIAALEDPVAAYKAAFYAGLVHMASYHRVGQARLGMAYGQRALSLLLPGEVWLSTRGWRANARNLLVGKRQLGSQRFPILEELKGLQ